MINVSCALRRPGFLPSLITLLTIPLFALPALEPAWGRDVQSPRRAAAPPQVGSAMAVLATLGKARVLPPEQSPEANHVIRSVIQFQSAFAKSEDRLIREFADHAVARLYGERGAEVLALFRSFGWTAEFLEALADAEANRSAEELQTLAPGFTQYNLSVEDFHRFMHMIREARTALDSQGLSFQQVFASQRHVMPGAGRH